MRCLKKNGIKQGSLFLYTAKTGQPVRLPLAEPVLSSLEACPNKSTEFFFWTGESKKQIVVNNWRADLAKRFKRAEVPTTHPHCFRHTLAASLLKQGVPFPKSPYPRQFEQDSREAFRGMEPRTPEEVGTGSLGDWIGSPIRAFEFIFGVSEM
jgi:hypothetical protein